MLGHHENETLTKMNLPLMGSKPQVGRAPDGSMVQVTGFAMQSELTPSASIMEVIDPVGDQAKPLYGVKTYVTKGGKLIMMHI